MKRNTQNYDGVSAYTFPNKKQKKRNFNDFEIRSYADEDIIAGIKKHYPDDIENSIIRFDLVNKYLITDKNVLYATHNFTRGYTCDEMLMPNLCIETLRVRNASSFLYLLHKYVMYSHNL